MTHRCTARRGGLAALLIAATGMLLMGAAGPFGCARTSMIPELAAGTHCEPVTFEYPHKAGRLSFPKDEGKHSLFDWPMTVIEWYAFYVHLVDDAGTRYLLFTTFVTYDPIEPVLRGRFPHIISTLVDVTNNRTYHHSSMIKLKRFSRGHADAETAKADHFKWKGISKPFEYSFRVAWCKPDINYSLDLDLKMIKPLLAVGGTGYVKQPQGVSGYYSQTRVRATGCLTIRGKKKSVSGIAWIDRQWLGVASAGVVGRYIYDWWALQLENNEEAIMYRIRDVKTKEIVSALLEINHADGTREPVDKFTILDTSSGWHLSAPGPGWNLRITRACKSNRSGRPAKDTIMGASWHSCDVTGTVAGRRTSGVAVAELVPKTLSTRNPALDPTHARASAEDGVTLKFAKPTKNRDSGLPPIP